MYKEWAMELLECRMNKGKYPRERVVPARRARGERILWEEEGRGAAEATPLTGASGDPGHTQGGIS